MLREYFYRKCFIFLLKTVPGCQVKVEEVDQQIQQQYKSSSDKNQLDHNCKQHHGLQIIKCISITIFCTLYICIYINFLHIFIHMCVFIWFMVKHDLLYINFWSNTMRKYISKIFSSKARQRNVSMILDLLWCL